ncbi:MAG: hypothetical protein HYR96_11115 [Deltaproteobacteria bacterium]|nr:hypothetical protein [Deltaproteobacteria bacterium]
MINVDPGVVEVITRPETLSEIQSEKNLSRVQKFIFDVAKDLDLRTRGEFAHFNFGIMSAFKDDPRGFLKFFINYHNFAEISSGALGSDHRNAPLISHLEPEQRLALSKIVDDVNAGMLKTPQEVASRIQMEVYTATPIVKNGPEHYQGIGLKYIVAAEWPGPDQPAELRGIVQPKNAREAALQAELFQLRIECDKTDPDPIAFIDIPRQPMTFRRLARVFRLYLAEMGADWNHFKELLPAHLQNPRHSSIDAFMAGNVHWSVPGDVEDVLFYAPYVANSSWVRKRMRTLLSFPKALSSGATPRILQAISLGLGSNPNQESKRRVDSFIDSINGTGCSGVFNEFGIGI